MQSPIHEVTLRGLASNLGKEWKRLATHLEIRKDEVDRIEADHGTSEEQTFQMLMTWWQRWDNASNGPDSEALDVLCEALMNSGRLDLITNIRGSVGRTEVLNLELCRAEFIRYYKQAMGHVPLLPWVSSDVSKIEDIFVGLHFIENRKKAARVLQREISFYAEMLLLQFHDDQPVRYILLSGVAGSGKTTIVSKISNDWAMQTPESPLAKFSLLLTLNLRELQGTPDLIEAVYDQILPEDTSVSRDSLGDYMKTHASEVLVILDGADEFGTGGSQLPAEGDIVKIISGKILRGCTVVVTTRPHMVDSLSRLNPSFTRVESKGFSNSAILQYIQRFFQDEDSQVSSDLYGALMEYDNLLDMARLPIMLLIMCLVWSEDRTLPESLTGAFKDAVFFILKRHFKKPGQFDGLDDEGFLESELKELVQGLGKAALDALMLPGQKLVFEPADFGNTAVVEKACKIGILSQERVRSKLRAVQNVTFIHKTFQEAFAGFYLADLAEEDVDSFNHYLHQIHVENTPSLADLLRFCSGANINAARSLLRHIVRNVGLEEQGETFSSFLLMLLEARSNDLHGTVAPLLVSNKLLFNFTCSDYLKSGFEFLTECASQSMASHRSCTQPICSELKQVVLLDVTESDIPVVTSLLKHAFNVSDVILGLGKGEECVGIKNVPISLCEALCQMASLEHLSLFPSKGQSVSHNRQLDLSDVVKHLVASDVTSFLQEFVLQWVTVGPRLFQKMHKKRSNPCKAWDFLGRSPAVVSCKDAVHGRESKRSHQQRLLTQLKVGSHSPMLNISGLGGSVPRLRVLQLLHSSRRVDLQPASILLSKAPLLQVVDFSHNEIGDAFPGLAKPLSGLRNLKELILNDTGLSSDHIVLLTKEVLPLLANLGILSLSHNHFSSPDALLSVVRWSCSASCLKELFLGGCVEVSSTPMESYGAVEGDSGYYKTEQTNKTQTLQSSVEILDVRANHLGRYTSQLIKLLKLMPALKTANMGYAGLAESDAVDLAEAVATCHQLQKLHLDGNADLGNDGVEALFKVLPTLPDIQHVCLTFSDKCEGYSDMVRKCHLKCWPSMLPGLAVLRRAQIEAVTEIVQQSESKGPAMPSE